MSAKNNLTKQTLLFYWQNVWKYPHYVIGVLISVPLTVLVNNYLPPLILANVLFKLSKGEFQPHHIVASFGKDLLAYTILVLTGSIIGWRVVDMFDWRLEANVERNIAQRVFGHLLSQSAGFHANHFSGSMVSQTNKLMGSYVRFADTTVFQVLVMISNLLLAAIILANRAPLYVVVLFIFSFFYISSSFFVTRKVRRLSVIQADAESKQTGYLADSITNVMAISSFAGIRHEKHEFAKATNRTRNHLFDIMRANLKQQTYFSIVISTISALALAMAVVSVMVFNANIATVFLILNYTASITTQLFQFSNSSIRNYNRSFGDAANMIEILQLEPEIKDPAKPEQLRISNGAINFQNVTFTHDGSDGALFHNLNLDIKSGEKIGLVGRSGSGKTTFTRLLLRFSDLDGGEISIDGQNIANVTQDDLRRSIAYVPQEPLLFHRSIRENISYGKPNATENEIKETASKAYASEFIEKLPKKYETLVGERGIKLSGGQRQRIAIARAMLKDAPILLLDEATSALDSESEKLIQSALWKLMEGHTTIVIAHRLSTIQRMDRIIVLDEGKIVEQGSHEALLRSKGIYANLWQHQSGGFIED